jgi:broad specificity phosphatase PhoE
MSRAARAIETAEIVAAGMGVPLADPTCDLCEMHPGAAEGMTYEEMAVAFGPSYRDVPGAEYFPDWVATAGEALKRLAERFAGQRVVLVTHSAVIAASLEVLGGTDHELVAASPAPTVTAITEWSCTRHGDNNRSPGVWSLIRHNDAGHLLDGI